MAIGLMSVSLQLFEFAVDVRFPCGEAANLQSPLRQSRKHLFFGKAASFPVFVATLRNYKRNVCLLDTTS